MKVLHALYSRWIESPIARDIADSLRKAPDSWRPYSISGKVYTLDHASGIEIWVANGWWFCAVYRPDRRKLGLIGRTRVWLGAVSHIRAAEAREVERVRHGITEQVKEKA